MLQKIGAPDAEALWEAIPPEFRVRGPLPVDPPLAEYEIARRFGRWAEENADAQHYACFLGAGIYDHFIPAAVRSLLSRSEFATAYTPRPAPSTCVRFRSSVAPRPRRRSSGRSRRRWPRSSGRSRTSRESWRTGPR